MYSWELKVKTSQYFTSLQDDHEKKPNYEKTEIFTQNKFLLMLFFVVNFNSKIEFP